VKTFTWSHTSTIDTGDDRIEVRPLPAPIGAEIRGVDLCAPVSDATADAIRTAYDIYDVLVFPEQPLTPDDEMRAMHLFWPDIADADNGWGLNLPGYEKILLLSNVVEDGEPIGFHNELGMGWHIDGVGWDPPPGASSLFAVEVPPTGTCTWFASSTLGWDLLPPEKKAQADGMVASSDFIGSQRWLAANSMGYMAPIPDSEIPNYPPIAVPVVLEHPRTGRKSLFFNTGNPVTTWDNEGRELPFEEGVAILEELQQAVVGNPHNCFAVPWEENQLVVWNNRTTFHSAPDYDYAGHRRVFHQMTGRGPEIPLPEWATKIPAAVG
jgi:taurine dioxygenase